MNLLKKSINYIINQPSSLIYLKEYICYFADKFYKILIFVTNNYLWKFCDTC